MPDPLTPAAFVRLLVPALEQAAAIAAALEGRVPNKPKAGEDSPTKAALTIADTASQEALLVPLLGRFARAHLEAEEDTPSVGFFTGEAEHVRIVIDPIDGTLRFFLEGRGPYAVMAGLAVRDRYEAALVALPREGLFFHAVRGQGARVHAAGRPSRPVTVRRRGRRVFVSDGVPDPVLERLRAAGFEAALGCGGAIAVAPLVPGVAGGLRIAKGDSISVRGRIGALIAAEAGARVRTGAGEPFPDAMDAPVSSLVVAADDETAAALCAAAAPAL